MTCQNTLSIEGYWNHRPQSFLSLFKARQASKPAQSMANFKGSSDCSRPCPVMCSIPPEMEIPQLSSPAPVLDHFTVKNFFFFLIRISLHPSSFFTSRTHLHHLPPSFRQVRLPSAPFPHCLSSRLHKHRLSKGPLVRHRLHPPDWLGFSTRLFQFASVFPTLGIAGGTQHTPATSHTLDRREAWLDLLSHPPSHSHKRSLLIHVRPVVHRLPGPVLQSCSQPVPPDLPRWARLFHPTQGTSLSSTRFLPAQSASARWGSLRTGSHPPAEQQLPLLWSHPGACWGQAQPPHPVIAKYVSTLLCSKTTEAEDYHMNHSICCYLKLVTRGSWLPLLRDTMANKH